MSNDKYLDLIAKLVSGQLSTTEFKRKTEEQKEYLLGLIDQLLAGQLSVSEFKERFYPFVLDLLPHFMPERDEEFFEMVREKLEWTVEKPADEDIRHGVINHKQFIEWLRKEKESHFAAEKNNEEQIADR